MAYIKIRFITDENIISKMIEIDTFSEWSHVEFILADGTYLGARASGGVEIRPANYCKPILERRYSIPCTDEAYEKIISFATSKIGTSYNFLDIIGLFLHADLTSAGKEICSMFVIQAMIAGGIQMLNVLPKYTNLITPEMLHLSSLLIGNCYYSYPEIKVD